MDAAHNLNIVLAATQKSNSRHRREVGSLSVELRILFRRLYWVSKRLQEWTMVPDGSRQDIDSEARRREDTGSTGEPPAEEPSRSDGSQTTLPHDPSSPAVSEALPNAIGRYKIISRLGAGGESIVYLAWDPNLQREVAIKVGRSRHADSPTELDRLVQQGRLLAQVDHPNMERVVELGFHDGRPYLTTKYFSGQDLKQYARSAPMDADEAARLIAPIARALAAVHQQGITHRDIKPSNIVLDETNGQPRLIDFGIALLDDVWTREADRDDKISGTPQYMAPEQARGEPASRQSDVFALGAVLYFLLVNRPPFHGKNLQETLRFAQECQYDHRALEAKGIPCSLALICRRAMDADPAQRYPTADRMARALERFLQRRRRFLVAAASFVLAASGVAAYVYFGDGREVSAPASSLEVLVWKHDKARELLTAIPLRSGDDLQVVCQLPAELDVTLFWFDTEGKLHVLSPDAAATSPTGNRVVWPHPDRSNILDGPPGTEVIFLCGSREGRPRIQDVQAAVGTQGPWRPLAPGSLLEFDTRQIRWRRLRGPSTTELSRGDTQVRQRAEALRQVLVERFELVQGVAFPHVAP